MGRPRVLLVSYHFPPVGGAGVQRPAKFARYLPEFGWDVSVLQAANPSVPLLWRQTSTSYGIFPNLVVPMDTGAFTFLCMWPVDVGTTELELRWYAPAWEGDEVPEDHRFRMELFDTVMAQDTANMAPIQASVSSRGARPFQIGWHERLIHHFQRAVDLAIGPDRLPPGTAVSDALDGFVESA